MKNTTLWLAAAACALQLSSCVNTDRERATSADPRAVYTPPKASDRSRVSSMTVLNTVRASHPFSDPQRPDYFELQLRGTRVLTSMAHLTVVNANSDTLRHEVIPAQALLSNALLDDPQAATVRDKEIAILKAMNNFFNDSHFVQPAVSANAVQPAEVDTQTWNALLADRTAIAFDFPTMNGPGRRLAYARGVNKTVLLAQ